MTNKFITLIGILFFVNSYSQTIYKTDVTPQIGENYFKHTVDHPDSIHPGPSGMGKTWDLSNVNYSLQNDYIFQIKNPLSTPHTVLGATYVIKNYPTIDTTYTGYSYYKDTATGFYLLHDYQGIAERNYSSPEFLFKFPLKYGDSIFDTYCFSSTIFSTTSYYCGTSTLKFDGVGSLVFSGLSPITKVYRLKYESTVINQATSVKSITTKYFWYKIGIHHPIAEYTIYVESGGFTTYFASIYDAENTSGIKEPNQSLKAEVFPNPANEILYFYSMEHIQDINIFDVTGKLMLTIQPTNLTNGNINISSLSEGLYFVKITTDKGSTLKKINIVR